MFIRVIDFETTGMPPDAAVCEVGWSDVTLAGVRDGFEAVLCNPGRTIPPEARAVHHIGDADVVNAMSPDAAFLILNEDNPDVYCAHNAAFEKEFFTGGDRPWICTMKVARRIWPECPSHTNQCLRYWLGLDLNHELAMPPHRAGPDAYVTASILRAALEIVDVNDMIAWTGEPSLLPRVTFGKHRGSAWSDIPSDYLRWLVDKSDMDSDVKFTAKHHLSHR